ncbi:MAG: S-adenosylmethionine:tRNA ribosyltransferase-isomerase, partial [Patescibacteria group bacterium]
MINSFDKLLKSYHYSLPKELVALQPLEPRDSARLLVFDKQTNKIEFDYFFNLGKYLPPNS